MESFASLPSPSSAFAAYASISASVMLFKTTFNQIIPYKVQDYVLSIMNSFLYRTNKMTILIEERDGMMINDLFEDVEIYLCTKISPNIGCLRLSKCQRDSNIKTKFMREEQITDNYQGIELQWKFFTEKSQNKNQMRAEFFDVEKRFFWLRFDKKHKDDVLNFYMPFVVKKAEDIKNKNRIVKLHTFAKNPYSLDRPWDSVKLEHPSTFDTLAMDPGLKRGIMDDLDRFVKRREFYRKVGKAWKRGYLLYGPPGTGKSSLIAAIANYLKFDVYDLELSCIHDDSSLRRLLLRTSNRSILVIEDIDCSVKLPGRSGHVPTSDHGHDNQKPEQFTLCGLLNFIDGLWSSCGDERIIIFTTNNKEKLDPALLRPGRMDVHINMSYLTGEGFEVLASNYLGIHDHHHNMKIKEVQELIKKAEVTPAEVAEELMKTDDAHVCLDGVVNLLKRKKIGNVDIKEGKECDFPELKKPKIDIKTFDMKYGKVID